MDVLDWTKWISINRDITEEYLSIILWPSIYVSLAACCVKMKTIHCTQDVTIPSDCKVSIKSRLITVVGPRGTIKRNMKHLQLDIRMINKETIRVEKWFSNRKELAAVNTVCSHIQNMFTGVQRVSYPLQALDCRAKHLFKQ